MSIVYHHRRIDTNDIFYVGIGKSNKRAYSHYGRNKHWHSVVKKTDYIVEIVLESLTWKEACEQEKLFIKKIGRHDLGLGSLVNMTDGGDGGMNPSNQVRQKRSNSLIGNQNGKGNKGKPSPMKGRVHSDITKQKMSNAALGRVPSPTHIENLSLASPKKKTCSIDGVVFHSAAEAARQLGVDRSVMHKRLHSVDYKSYKYI